MPVHLLQAALSRLFIVTDDECINIQFWPHKTQFSLALRVKYQLELMVIACGKTVIVSLIIRPVPGRKTWKKVWKGSYFCWISRVPDTLRHPKTPLSLWLSVMIDLSVVPPKSKLWNWNLWFRLAAAARSPSGSFSFAPPHALTQAPWPVGMLFFGLRDQKDVDVQTLCCHPRCVRNWWLCCGPSTQPKTQGENTSDGGS